MNQELGIKNRGGGKASRYLLMLFSVFIFLFTSIPVLAADPVPYSGRLTKLLPVPGITCESLPSAQKKECKEAICPKGLSCRNGKCLYPNQSSALSNLPCNYTLDELVLTGINLVKIILGITGSLMLAFFVIAGYKMVISMGNPEAIKEARATLTAAFIGGILIIGAAVCVQFAAALVGGVVPGEEALQKIELNE